MKTWTKGIMAGLVMGVIILGSLPALANPRGPFKCGPAMSQPIGSYHGPRSGQLTPGEFHRLQNQQKHVQMAESRMMRDGRLDRVERARLMRMQSHVDRNAYRYAHNNRYYHPNRQHRPHWRPGWH
ncbi:MAG: hypothetical protein ACOZFS_14960 [Thermodesulfobacteriota bacterium]